MIFREAIRSLKNSRSKAAFFALTFYLTTALLFVYFNLAEAAQAGKPETFINAYNLADLTKTLMEGNAGNLMMVFVVIMCSIDLFFCNDFFVKNKAKELAVRLICGATYLQLAAYLLIQTMILMAIAIPLGIGTGYGLIHILNGMLAESGVVVKVTSYAMVEFVSVMIFIIFWTTLLNCSFAYKSGAVLLAGGNMNALMKKEKPFRTAQIPLFRILIDLAAAVLAVLPLYNFFRGESGLGVHMVIACVGLERLTTSVLIPLLNRFNRKKGMNNTVTAAAMGFFRRDIRFSKITVYLFLCDLLILMTMLSARENDLAEIMLIMISFAAISFLQAMTIMFRIETDLSDRGREYAILSYIGTEEEKKKKIMHREISMYYGSIILLMIIYAGTAVYSLYRSQAVSPQLILMMVLTSFIPLLAADIMTRIFYAGILKQTS